jgi:hypothetical protein
MSHLNGYWRVGLVVLALLTAWGTLRPALLVSAHASHHIAAGAF